MNRPEWKFVWLLIKTAFIGIVVIEVNNMLILGYSLAELAQLNLPLMAVCIAGYTACMMVLIWHTFGRLFRFFREGAPSRELIPIEEIVKYKEMCNRFPGRLAYGFMVIAVVCSLLYHTLYWQMSQNEWDWTDFAGSFAYEQMLSWLLAILLYNGSRQILRPIYSWLAESTSLPQGVQMSIRKRIIGTAVSFTIMMGMYYVFINVRLADSDLLLPAIAGYLIVFLCFGYVLARSAIDETANEIEQVRTSLEQFNEMKFPHHQRLKVEGADEVGELKVQFNLLQAKAEEYYRTFLQELEMASRVQAGLLSSSPLAMGHAAVNGMSVSAKDLGGDFYDFAIVDKERIAIIIGDVSGKGMPAALVTATVLGLFRAEVRYGGTPGELLQRMNATLQDMLMQNMYVSAGILVLHAFTGDYQYAGAGHLPPVLVNRQGMMEWETSSLPLGIGGEEPFELIAGTLLPGDSVVMYTDGALEAKSIAGEMVGFERLHQWIENGYRSEGSMLAELAAALTDYRGEMDREDDETIVVLRFG